MPNFMKKVTIIIFLGILNTTYANKISEAYKALSIYDYFKAKQLFYKCNTKKPVEASYGLAIIYLRTDNPFSNIDSAAKYIAISKHQFKDTITYSSFHINKTTVNYLSTQICEKGFNTYSAKHTVCDYNYFLSVFYFASDSLLNQAYYLRDELAYSTIKSKQSSDSVKIFLLQYPQTHLQKMAQNNFYEFEYKEQVESKINTLTEKQTDLKIPILKLFLLNYKNNPKRKNAELELFTLTKTYHSADSMAVFIKDYSSEFTKEEAWKNLYSLSVKNYSKDELLKFVSKYPNYPENDLILKEIEWTQKLLLPIKQANDLYGYVDTLGNWMIEPKYDDASLFSEGFAAVCKNDSCFYINKEGKRTSDFYYEEVENYKNGVAIVKKENLFYIVNRSGQFISKGYMDMNESSNHLFVCKDKGLYGAINEKGETVIPFAYTKLGNFKNGYAYYLSSNYGLINSNNQINQAKWDWISDVDTNSIVVVKKHAKFGLMHTNDELVLPVEYDFINYCSNGIYLIVKNNLYGFYNALETCFVTEIAFDYNQAYNNAYYTNGKYFKLLLDDEVALVDANGRYSINYGTYSNLFFAKCDIIRIQKNNKYGFVDRKLKAITPAEFDKASDFNNDIAIVSKGDITQLITKLGSVIYKLKAGAIEKINATLYKTSLNNVVGLIDEKGTVLLNTEFETIEVLNSHLFICKTSLGKVVLYNALTKQLKSL